MQPQRATALTIAIAGLLGGVDRAEAIVSDAQYRALEQRLLQLEKRLEESEASKAAAAPGAAGAASGAVAGADKTDEVKQLKQKVNVLERKMEVEKETTQATLAKHPKNEELGTQGLKVVSQDENFIMYLRALIQADGSYFMDDNVPEANTNGDSYADRFYMRRVRPIIEGTVWKWFDYRIMADFAGGTTRLFDAYADFRYLREASLTGGKFKAPVSLERLQSASALPFMERAFPTQLAPNRDIGLMLHGEFDRPGHPEDFSKLDRNRTYGGNFPMYQYPDFFSYQVGIFNGSRNNGNIDSDTNDSKEFQARIFSHPFLHSGIDPLEGLGVGIAGTWGQPNDDQLSNYQSAGLNSIFRYNSAARADGTQYRIYPQMYWIWGPFQFVGEYALSDLDLENQTVVNKQSHATARTNETSQAWNATASYMLTGEQNTFLNQGIRPRHNFNPMEGHWGAFQVAARFTSLNFDDDVFRNIGTADKPIYPFADPRSAVSNATAWALGINWWLNPNYKLMFDYTQTAYNDGAGIYADNGSLLPYVRSLQTEKVWQTRIQVNF